MCPDKFGKNIKICPYNNNHKVDSKKLQQHKNECLNRPTTINPDVETEMKDYLSKQDLKYQPIIQIKTKQIMGLKPKEKEKQEGFKNLLNMIEVFEEQDFEQIDQNYSFSNDLERL
jgi:hypothetical protein